MAVILWAMGLSLLMQGCMCSVGQTERGCLKWTKQGDDVCCEVCQPGNRLFQKCGPDPKNLCTPCEANTYTVEPKSFSCKRCTQCVGVQVLVKECTTTTDTKCGCKEGFTCGNEICSYCVKTCGKGEEPTEERSCRPCQNGTFNDQNHQKCKPWSNKCPNPNQMITALGNKVSDIECANITTDPVILPKKPGDHQEQAWPLVLSVLTSGFLMAISIIAIIFVSIKINQKRKMTKKTITKPPIIRTPTDDPATLIAIECSFHEAQQEQGSSSESLASEDSSKQLIG